jgi:hypothetical protein
MPIYESEETPSRAVAPNLNDELYLRKEKSCQHLNYFGFNAKSKTKQLTNPLFLRARVHAGNKI